MASNSGSELVQQLRTLILHFEEPSQTDEQLLHLFVAQRNEAAFARIVQRYGPMVWGICRRMLRGQEDVEDAFQATFLVLVRRASSITQRALLANWLYGVAHRTALKARSLRARQQLRERQVAAMPEPGKAASTRHDDLETLLDQELSRLPDKYRSVILLCDLEGRTRKEAARLLGCPEGTVAGRLARARQMLAKRLAQHGALLSTGSLVAMSSASLAAEVPTALVRTTIATGAALAGGTPIAAVVGSTKVAGLLEGVLKSMLLTRLNTALGVLVILTTLGIGVGGLLSGTAGGEPTRDGGMVAGAEQEEHAPEKDKEEKQKADQRREFMELAATREAIVNVHGIVRQLEQSLGKEAAFRAMEKIEESLRDTRERKLSPGRRPWTLGFEFKYPRCITVDLRGKGPMRIWYMVYTVTNPDVEAHVFIPDFELAAGNKVYSDVILPAAGEAVQKLEAPGMIPGFKNSVQISMNPIHPDNNTTGGRGVKGIVTWEDELPEVEDVTLFVAGLSNQWDFKDNRISRRMLKLNFKRTGDEMGPATPVEWEWVTRSAGTLVPQAFRKP